MADSAQSDSKPPRPKGGSPVEIGLTVSRETTNLLLAELRQVVRDSVREELSARLPEIAAAMSPAAVPDALKPATAGIELLANDQIKARDLRLELLPGRLPENSGLLIDTETTAKLLGISRRALERMVAGQSILMPIRIAGRMSRWRLAELLEWIEAGCPHPNHWTYNPNSGRPGKGRR